jgi:UDP-hydrolysing UDP-N-acetyl-D-glucosamine 2-epimerase
MRKIAVITGTRADFGHLLPIVQAMKARKDNFCVQIIATGSHLLGQHGHTLTAITEAGLSIDDTVDILLASNTSVAVAKAMGLATLALAESFARLEPDGIMVLGDRYELLAASQVAMVMNIPIIHVHGGEITTGAFDDSIRHAITKMATMHFVAAEPYRKRVVQLGESPHTVHNVGAPGLDYLDTMIWLSKEELAQELQLELNGKIFLVTFHPVTRQQDSGVAEFQSLLEALSEYPNASIIFTHANADNRGDLITRAVHQFSSKAPLRRRVVPSLGQLRYLSTVKISDVVIGNSSSGLIEVPALRKPTVNIGERQGGRLRAPSVIDTPAQTNLIKAAIDRALSPDMGEILKTMTPPYGVGGAGEAIAEIVSGPWPKGHKVFHDLPYSNEGPTQ